MNITFLYSGYSGVDKFHQYCTASSGVPGDEIDITIESFFACVSDGRVVKEVPCDRLLLVDNCLRRDYLKIVSNDCSFLILANDDELNETKPVLKELIERKIFVLTEAKRHDLKAIKEICRQSFYTHEGELINEKFALRNLSPSKMAEVGFKFVGDNLDDTTACYFNRNHKLGGWEESNKPLDEHIRNFRRCGLCIDNMKYRIPVLSLENGQEIPGQAYHLIMPNVWGDRSNKFCDRAIILSHPDAPIKQIPFNDMLEEIDLAKLAQVKKLLNKKQNAREIDTNYFDLLKKSVVLHNFSGLLRDFKQTNHKFIAQLESYKPELHTLIDLDTVEQLLNELKSNPVEKEVAIAVEKLATLELVKATSKLLDHLPVPIRETGSSRMEDVAIQELSKFAGCYAKRYYSNDYFNDLVTEGTLGCLFTNDYFKSSERSEKLMLLLEQGVQLSECLVNISEKIKELLKPFLPQDAER